METGMRKAVEPEPCMRADTRTVTYPSSEDEEGEGEQTAKKRLRDEDQPEGVNLERCNPVKDYTAGPVYDL